MALRASIEWGGDNLSEQLNRNYGLLPSGIYHGFKVKKVNGQAKVKISKDGQNLSLALINKDVYQLHCTDETEPLLEVPVVDSQKIYALVIDADYQWGQKRATTYQLIDPDNKQDHHCELARITVPESSDDSADYRLDESHRDQAQHYGNMFPLGMTIPIASNLKGTKNIPPSGIVSRDGWMYCDGSPIPDGLAVEGNTPNLTDGRFLRGSSVQDAGKTGGHEQFTLTLSNLPAHAHSIHHGHGGGTHGAGGHGHGGGTHGAGSHGHSGSASAAGGHGHGSGSAGNHRHWVPNMYGSEIQGTGTAHRLQSGGSLPTNDGAHLTTNAGGHNHSIHASGNHSHSLSISGAGSHSHSLSISGAGHHSHNLSISSYSGQSGQTGDGSAVTHLPKYFDAPYLIKVN